MAQRKFAQGVYIPPYSAQITNRKVTGLVKDETNIIRRQTTAKVLLDVISLESIHKHTPVVLLERLNVDAVENIIAEPDNSLVNGVNSTPSVPIKSLLQTQITARNLLLKRSVPKKNLKRVKRRRNPIRKAAFKASLRWKYTSSVDTEFSVDDDQPLTYFTRLRQNAIIMGSKNDNSGPKSTPSHVIELPLVKNDPEPSTSVGNDNASINDGAESTITITNTEQSTQDNDETPLPFSLRSRSSRHVTSSRGGTICERSDISSMAEIPNDDAAKPGPSGVRSSAQGSTNGAILPGPNRNHGRKGKAKDKSKCPPPPDAAQPGPSTSSGGQSRFHAQSEIDLNQGGHWSQSPLHFDSSFDDLSQPTASSTDTVDSLARGMSGAEDPESRNKMIRVWLENGIFKVPEVPKARTLQNSPHLTVEEERPRRQRQSGGRRSYTLSRRLGSGRSSSPMSNMTTLDSSESEQDIDADATEITVPTRRHRMQVWPLRRHRVRHERPKLADAPTFYPSEDEFKDPVTYFEKIMPYAAKYGLCKVVAPPGFKPQCKLNDAMRFTVFNQYITRIFRRWSSLTREACTMRSHLATLKIACTQPPLLGGMEVNLPKLYESVNNNGGLKNMNKKAWVKVAEELNCGKLSNPDRKLDQLYMKYVVPYNSLSQKERKEMIRNVEELWQKRHRRMLDRASNPLHTQKHMLGESDSSDDDGELEDEKRFPHLVKQLIEAEECIIKGRPMDLLTFRRIANNVQKRYLPKTITINEIENSYWSSALMAEDHVCVYSASVETSSEGYGFTNNPNEPYGQHPWNLKMLNQNNGNILRLLGSVVGLTIPTLHLGMLYSTSCWHRDPHGLPWMEYMHEGPPKIWYGIPDEESEKFRKAVETLCPTSCQNKSIWLPSDMTMIPPNFLLEHSVSMSKVLQKPGEFVIVFPKAYSCSIATGFTVSESVYFAYNAWINNISQVFQELRDSCEPSMFSLEHLVISAATDPRASLNVLQLVHASMSDIVATELAHRAALAKHGLKPRLEKRNNPTGIVWNISEEDECEICRANLHLSRVNGVFHRNSALCTGHALQVLDERIPNIRRRSQCQYELVIFMTETELKAIIDRISKRLLDMTMTQAFPRVV